MLPKSITASPSPSSNFRSLPLMVPLSSCLFPASSLASSMFSPTDLQRPMKFTTMLSLHDCGAAQRDKSRDVCQPNWHRGGIGYLTALLWPPRLAQGTCTGLEGTVDCALGNWEHSHKAQWSSLKENCITALISKKTFYDIKPVLWLCPNSQSYPSVLVMMQLHQWGTWCILRGEREITRPWNGKEKYLSSWWAF